MRTQLEDSFPRKGTETACKTLVELHECLLEDSFPRKRTETMTASIRSTPSSKLEDSFPRKGTETCVRSRRPASCISVVRRFISPQGDGNSTSMPFSLQYARGLKNHFPARGQKHGLPDRELCYCVFEESFPRKGTETILCSNNRVNRSVFAGLSAGTFGKLLDDCFAQ